MITTNVWSKDVKSSDNTVMPTIKWIAVNPNTDSQKLKVPCRENGKQTSTAIFDIEYNRIMNCSLYYTDGHSVEMDCVGGRIIRIGILTFGRDVNERILVISEDGGTGGNGIDLDVVCPRYETYTGISMWFSANVTAVVPDITTTDNYNDKRLHIERQYLEKLKYEYGFISDDEISKKQNDPAYAWYFWNKDNGKVVHGILKIRKYKGKPEESGSVLDTLVDDNITYKALFKAGVIAYDSKTDEHYVLFHPVWSYSWPTKLVKKGPI